MAHETNSNEGVDVNEILASVTPMTRAIVARVARNRQDADRADISAVVMAHLGRHSLPLFDPSKGVKLSTFLYRCAERKASEVNRQGYGRGRRRLAKGRMPSTIGPTTEYYSRAASDQRLDHRIEAVAAAVQQHPEKYLTAAQAKFFRTIQAAPPGTMQKNLLAAVGIKNEPEFSDMLRRIKDRITAISIEDFEV